MGLFNFFSKEQPKPVVKRAVPAGDRRGAGDRREGADRRIPTSPNANGRPVLKAVPKSGEPSDKAEKANPEQSRDQTRDQELTYSIGDLPVVKIVLTSSGTQFELSKEHQKYLVAFETDGREVWILVDPSFASDPATKMFVFATREKIRKAGLKCANTKTATLELIDQVNQMAKSLMEEASFVEPTTEEAIRFDEIVSLALRSRATDIHFEVRAEVGAVRYRIDGELEPMRSKTKGIYPRKELENSIAYAFNKLVSDRTNSDSAFNPQANQSCMIPYKVGAKRMNLRYQSAAAHKGFDAIVRFLEEEERKIETTRFQELGYSDDQAEMLEVASRTRTGMIMIAGITGSGKTTTLKTIIENIPGREGLKIFTVEDPVEYEISGVTQMSVQRSLSNATEKTPYNEIQAVLMRCDPDTIMQGEIRDQATGEAAQVFIETGHQVMATVHANSVLGVFPRLLAKSIGFALGTLTTPQFWSLIIYQALVPKLCDHCKVPANDVIPGKVAFIRETFEISTDEMYCKKDGGCVHCDHRGTKGQTVVAEMMQPNRLVLRHIRNGEDYEAEKAWRAVSDKKFDTPEMAGKTVFEHALYKAYKGLIDPRVVERFETFERYERI